MIQVTTTMLMIQVTLTVLMIRVTLMDFLLLHITLTLMDRAH